MNIDPEGDTPTSYISITDKDGNYCVEIYAIKDIFDNRIEYQKYQYVDEQFNIKQNSSLIDEDMNFWRDEIVRKYDKNDGVELKTKCIYAGEIIYVFAIRYNKIGQKDAEEIENSFKSSKIGGILNSFEHKSYSLWGDNFFTSFLNELGIPILLTIIFWCCETYWILYFYNKKRIFRALIMLVVFIICFGYIVVHDDFMGYIYGYNSIWKLIGSYFLAYLF